MITEKPFYIDHKLTTNRQSGDRLEKNCIPAKHLLARLKMGIKAALQVNYVNMDFGTAKPIDTEILQTGQWNSTWTYALTAAIVANCPVGLSKDVFVKAFKNVTIDHYLAIIPRMVKIKERLAKRRVKGLDLNLEEGIAGLLSLAKLVRR